MTPTASPARTHLLHALVRVRRPDVPLRVALRTTAAVVLPLGIGLATGHEGAGLGMAAGALNVMFCDQPGPYLQRLRWTVLTALAGALAGLSGFLVAGQTAALLILLMVSGFAAGMLVVFGANAARVGMTSVILLVVTSSTPMPLAQALQAAGLILAGGLLLALFSVMAWPLQLYRPERHALAGVYRELARMASGSGDEHDAPPLSDTLNALQQTLLGMHRAHGRAMQAFRVLLDLAERIRLELLALEDLEARSPGHPLHAPLERAAAVLDAVAEALMEGSHPAQATARLAPLRDAVESMSDAQLPAGARTHVRALQGQLAAAVRNADWAGSRGERRAREAETDLPHALRSTAPVATLRANLRPSSPAFRHALRMAVCLALALGLAHLAGIAHGYWMPMTAAIVLRPDFGATMRFGLLRVIGTVLGLVLTTALLWLAPDSAWSHLLLIGVLCFGFRYLASAQYGVAVAALTGTVVILLAFEGVASGPAVLERVENTTLGCALALSAYLLWPTWERRNARQVLAGQLQAYAAYLGALADPDDVAARREARTAVRVARTHAQASLDRLGEEPAGSGHLLRLASAVLANGNRLSRTSMCLEAMIEHGTPLPLQADVGSYLHACRRATEALAGTLEQPRPGARTAAPQLPDLRLAQHKLALRLATAAPADETGGALAGICDRLADNIDTLAHVIARHDGVAAG